MSDTRLSDEELRRLSGVYEADSTAGRLAAELIARRAAESEVPFAVGDVVTASGHSCTWHVTAAHCVEVENEHGEVLYCLPKLLTPVPPSPTAAEVFEEAYAAANPGSHVAGKPTLDAFREFCRAWNIDADKPLGGDAE